MNGDTRYKVSVIVPALNEEANISRAVENIVRAYEKLDINGEIVVIDDGSNDRTGDIVRELMKKYPFIQLVRHETPQGVGASYWDGVQDARGEIVTWLPGDAENDAAEVLRYLPLMDQVDVIIPYVYNTQVRPLQRRVLSKTYKAIINVSFGMLLNYMNGSVMFRKCALENITLRNMGFFFQTELLIKCLRREYLYAEVPCALGQRSNGKSKATTLKSLLKVSNGYLNLMFDVYLFHKTDKTIAPASVTAQRFEERDVFVSGKGEERAASRSPAL